MLEWRPPVRPRPDLSMAKSHFKQPPEPEVAHDSAFPSGSYGDQCHFQVWTLLVWHRPDLSGIAVHCSRWARDKLTPQ